MTKTYTLEENKCPSRCKNEYIPCPHNVWDADGWCDICGTPADEKNPKISCPDSWHD